MMMALIWFACLIKKKEVNHIRGSRPSSISCESGKFGLEICPLQLSFHKQSFGDLISWYLVAQGPDQVLLKFSLMNLWILFTNGVQCLYLVWQLLSNAQKKANKITKFFINAFL